MTVYGEHGLVISFPRVNLDVTLIHRFVYYDVLAQGFHFTIWYLTALRRS